jgi:hypothetical protein
MGAGEVMTRDEAIKAMRAGKTCVDYTGTRWKIDVESSILFSKNFKYTAKGEGVWIKFVIPYSAEYDGSWNLAGPIKKTYWINVNLINKKYCVEENLYRTKEEAEQASARCSIGTFPIEIEAEEHFI